jgi:hypothetical protein
VYNRDAEVYARKRVKLPLSKVRIQENQSMAWTNIFGEYVALYDIEDNITVALIRDKNIADNFKKQFKMSWKLAKN